MHAPVIRLAAAGVFLLFAACSPEVGSPEWCEAMRDKPKGDWSVNEARDFAEHCLV